MDGAPPTAVAYCLFAPMNSFQTIVLVIFAIFATVGTIVFSGFFSSREEGAESAQLILWGTLPSRQLDIFLAEFNKEKLVPPIRYVEFTADNFDQALVEALAESRGPDLILLPHDLLLRHQAKIAPVLYSSLPQRTFEDSFIDQAKIFSGVDGILGFPLFVDPIVLYWNKDLFTNAELLQSPSSWEQVMGVIRRLTKVDGAGNIIQSAIGLGTFQNVAHAKDILSLLLLQSGEEIVYRDSQNRKFSGILGVRRDGNQSGAEASLRFFTEFSNPTKPDTYTWNSALRLSRTMFTDGDLAMYLGPWSEHRLILERNPHLNFDVAVVPQRENGLTRTTYGKLFVVAPLKSSPNNAVAISASATLAKAPYASKLSEIAGLPPARRDLLENGTDDPDQVIAYRSAILSRGWLDPEPSKTNLLFRGAVEAITSGSSRESGAATQLASQLQDLLPEEAL